MRTTARKYLSVRLSKGAGLPADKAPLMDVKSLSDRYEAKYDRMSFLKNNMEYVWRY